MSLPRFPEFVQISTVPEVELRHFLEAIPPYYDYLYSSLWSWNIDNSYRVSSIGENLVFIMRDPKSQVFFYNLIGTDDIPNCTATIFTYLESQGIEPALSLVPAETAELLEGYDFELTEDRDDFDYIYRLQDLAELEGSVYRSKRRQVNQFLKQVPDYKATMRTLTPEVKVEILSFISNENRRRSKLGYLRFAEYEMAVLERFFLLKENPNIQASLIYDKEKLIACSIDELYDKNWAVSHFVKADSDYKGAIDAINNMAAKFLLDKGVEFWNWADDIGLEGLRQAKLSYRPIAFFKKYSVTKNNL